jgi:hypothetical protein
VLSENWNSTSLILTGGIGRYHPIAAISIRHGHAIAQEDKILPAGFYSISTSAICGGQSVTGLGFLQVLWSTLRVLFAPTAPHSLVIPSSTLYSLDQWFSNFFGLWRTVKQKFYGALHVKN